MIGGSMEEALAKAVKRAVAELVTTSSRPEGVYVSTPILYPSGRTAVIRVSGGGDRFFVSDYGLGYEEAEHAGASRTYVRRAKRIAEIAGISFDSRAFFVVEVSLDQLAGAIATVANCSVEAMVQTLVVVAERSMTDGIDFMVEKLEQTFGARHVHKNREVVGASNHEWRFPAVVETTGYSAVFDFVTAHPNSVAAASTKMADVQRLPKPPRRLIMVHKKADLGTFLGVISPVASVVEDTLTPDQIRHALDTMAA